jgi:hypothetical protein
MMKEEEEREEYYTCEARWRNSIIRGDECFKW